MAFARQPSQAPRIPLLGFGADLMSQVAKRNQPVRRFIPEHEPNASEALPSVSLPTLARSGCMAKRKWQPIKRNSAAQMVDVVHADICGEPAQHQRKS